MRIGELARATGLAPSAIRFYEEEGLLPAARRLSGRRVFDDTVTIELRAIAGSVDENCAAALDYVLIKHGTQDGSSYAPTQVSDARLDYRGGGNIEQAQIQGWLGRFFNSWSPF